MNYILFDGPLRDNLLPLTFTRPVADIRLGISTLREKWEDALKTTVSVLTEKYLSEKFPLSKGKRNVLVNASALPDKELIFLIENLKPGEQLVKDGIRIAARIDGDFEYGDFKADITNEIIAEIGFLKNTWDIFAMNGKYIEMDFATLTRGRASAKLSETNSIRGDRNNIFIEEGAIVEFAYLNAEAGPVYIGRDVEIMEGSKIRGPFASCENSTIKMDAKIYGATTIGPHCKVGGELNNVVFIGYSNKAHDGFLGNAVIGEWCNLGADTNNSNLKNTYEEVKLWSYPEKRFVKTGLQFCGLIMGDHSKSGINTMFNTGTVVGVSCNVFGAGFQRNFIPSFSWGSPAGMQAYNMTKAIQVAKAVYSRRGMEFDPLEEDIFKCIASY